MSTYKEKLERIDKELTRTAKTLETNPLTHETLCLMQGQLQGLSLQARWTLAGPLARLIMTEQVAMLGHEKEKSLAGFTGPILDKLQRATQKLMASVLPADTGSATGNTNTDLLLTSTQVLTMILVYVTTQILGNSKELFPRGDPAATAKAGQFYLEIGLIFMLSSRTIESAFQLVTRGLDIEGPIQKKIGNIGLAYMLLILMALTEADDPKNEELMETLMKYMAAPLNALEEAMQKAASKGAIDDELAMRASGQLQLLRMALDKGEAEAVVQSIRSGLEALELPYEELKKDVKHLARFSAQFHQSLMGIFAPTEQSMTTMTQSA